LRLQHFIAACGVASRRKAEELIAAGVVKVNGKTVAAPGLVIDAKKDSVKVNNKLIKPESRVYIVMNKPAGTACTVSDEKGRKTVVDIIKPAVKQRIFPVGRLDFNTTGCLLFTNDGAWANAVTHPSAGVEKKYFAKIRGRAPSRSVELLEKGVMIEGRRMSAKKVFVMKSNDKNDVLAITLTGGMNHQVKKMMAAAGIPPVWLKRYSVGKINARGLSAGQWRYLSKNEKESFGVIK